MPGSPAERGERAERAADEPAARGGEEGLARAADADADAGVSADADADADTTDRRAWLLVVLGFVVVEAAAFGMRGAVVPELGREFGVGPELLGLVQPAGTVGFVAVLLVVGAAAGRLDLERTMLVGAAALGAALLALGLAPTFLAFLALVFARGSLTGVFRGVDRPVIGHLYADARGRAFNLYDLAWAGGAALGPVALLAATALGDWRYAYLALGAALVPVVVGVSRLDLSIPDRVERPFAVRDVPATLRNPRVAGATLGMLCTGGLEGGVYTWLPTYAAAHLPRDLAGLSVTVFTLAYVPGRLVAGLVADRVGYVRLLTTLAGLAVPTAYVTFLVLSGPTFLIGVATLGLLWAGMFPTLVAYAVDAVPEHSGPVSALTASSAYAGIAVVPAGMGLVIGADGVAVAMRALVAIAGVATLVLVGTWALQRRESDA